MKIYIFVVMVLFVVVFFFVFVIGFLSDKVSDIDRIVQGYGKFGDIVIVKFDNNIFFEVLLNGFVWCMDVKYGIVIILDFKVDVVVWCS